LINFLSHVMTFWRTPLNFSINNTKLKSVPIQIKREIYQGDSLSLLWFCLAINPLINLLNSTGYGFNIRLNNTTLSKLNHLLYMDDIKLYASKKNHILSLLTKAENFSNDIGMSFGIDKCKTQSICRGHYENLEYITKGEIIKNLSKGEFYKYLSINQSNHIQHSIIKENLENSILCNKIYKRHFRHAFYVRHERSVAERVFNKQVSREVYKRVEYYTFSTTKLTNGTHKRNKQLFY
jgi:hypothetical protein